MNRKRSPLFVVHENRDVFGLYQERTIVLPHVCGWEIDASVGLVVIMQGSDGFQMAQGELPRLQQALEEWWGYTDRTANPREQLRMPHYVPRSDGSESEAGSTTTPHNLWGPFKHAWTQSSHDNFLHVEAHDGRTVQQTAQDVIALFNIRRPDAVIMLHHGHVNIPVYRGDTVNEVCDRYADALVRISDEVVRKKMNDLKEGTRDLKKES